MAPPDKTASPDYRQPVLEALCAFVREHTIGMIVGRTPATDVQAVLDVVGRRRPRDVAEGSGSAAARWGEVNLSGAHLDGAFLSGAHLDGANLFRAFLSDAHLDGANLFRAHLDGASLEDAHLFLANLDGADLTGANLTDADLSRSDLSRSDLTRADMGDADLSHAALKDVRGLSQAQLDAACGTGVHPPDGLTFPDRPCPPPPATP